MAATLPEKPALQAHPVTTVAPLLLGGHNTGKHEEL